MAIRISLVLIGCLAFCGCGGDASSTADNQSNTSNDSTANQSGDNEPSNPSSSDDSDSNSTPPGDNDTDTNTPGGNSETDNNDDQLAGGNNNQDDGQSTDNQDSETVDIDALMQRASAMVQSNPGGAIPLLEQVVEAAPENRQALFMLGVAQQFKGIELAQVERMSGNYMLLQSAATLKKLSELGDMDEAETTWYSQALYNEACTLAITDKLDEAMASLQLSFDAGFNDMPLIESDSDLDALRDRDDFSEAVASLKESLAGRFIEEAKAQLASFESYDFNFSLPDLEGDTVSLDQFKGKVLIVDFWGTWCPPCRQEIPHFIALNDTYGESGFQMIGLNYERVPDEEVIGTITEYVTSEGVNYPCLVGDEETRAQVPEFRGYPTTLFIDHNGVVRAQLVGYHEYEVLEAFVTTLLEEANGGIGE